MINTTKYKEITLDMKITRKAARGFVPFTIDFIDELQQNNEIKHLLELGIAGGGSQAHFGHATVGTDVTIYGIDLLDLNEDLTVYDESYHDVKEDTDAILERFSNIKFRWATDAYDPDTPELVLNEWGLDKFDIVIDDAAVDWPIMKYSLPVWKNYTKLAYMTHVPDGMGVESWWARTREQHIENFNELAPYGLVVFDLEQDKNVVPGHERDWDSHFMGIWLPDWSLAKNTIEKYRHCIVSGESNIEF